MGWPREESGDAYKPELTGPVGGLAGERAAKAEARGRFGCGVTEAGNTGGGQTCLL